MYAYYSSYLKAISVRFARTEISVSVRGNKKDGRVMENSQTLPVTWYV